MTVHTRTNVPLTEEFEELDFSRYTTATGATTAVNMGRIPGISPYVWSLTTQQHIDVRTFMDSTVLAGVIPENWTVSPSYSEITLGPNVAYNYWPSLTSTLNGPGLTTFTSTPSGTLDLTQLGNESLLTLVIPISIADGLDLTQSFITLTDSNGDTATVVLAVGYNNGLASFLITDFDAIDLTTVGTVTIGLYAFMAATPVSIFALRVVNPSWIPASMDIDNWNGFYRQPVPVNANTAYYPATAAEQMPPIWRAASTGPTDDPQPIDATIAVIFNTGASNFQDYLSVNMRQVGGTQTSQLLLDGLTQAQMNGPQPGRISTDLLPREVGDLQGMSMATLGGESMLDLTAVEEQVTTTWIQFEIQWGASPFVAVFNTATPSAGYRWDGVSLPALLPNTYYMAVFTLVDTAARIQIFDLDQQMFSTQISQATTTVALPPSTPITNIQADVTESIPAGTIQISHGIQSQTFVTPGALVGATNISVTLQETNAVYPVGSSIDVPAAGNTVLFDTGVVNDSYQFVRQPGRFGWSALFLDGNATLSSIRPQSLVFSEYQSSVLTSNTPVQAARLYAQFTPNVELWTAFGPLVAEGFVQESAGSLAGLYPSPHLYPSEFLYPTEPQTVTPFSIDEPGATPIVSQDFSRQLTGASYKVFIPTANVPGQGVVSNVLTPPSDPLSGIIDFANCEIHLSVWFPSAAQEAGSALNVFLISQSGNVVPLSMPVVRPDHWQDIVIYPPSTLESGRYQLAVVYDGDVPATFWIDAVSVFERVITWSARANQGDTWIDFKDVVNTDTGGVTFTNRGTQLQLRAQAHQQAGAIFSAPNLVPVYAQLGNFSFPEDVIADPWPTTPNATFTTTGSTVHPATLSFTAVGSNPFSLTSGPYGSLSSPLSTGAAISVLPITVFRSFLAGPIVVYDYSRDNFQVWNALSGSTASLPVSPQVPNATYPGGAEIFIYAPPHAVISYQWSFGDGGSSTGPTTQHTFLEAGTYTITLTIIDTFGGRSVVNSAVVIT